MPTRSEQPTIEQTRQDAERIYWNFMNEQLQQNAIDTSQLGDIFADIDGNQLMQPLGADLRRIADKIRLSSERLEIQARANLASQTGRLSYTNFSNILMELFSDGVTRERIVVLFFFCSDLAVHAYNNQPGDYFKELIRMGLKFIFDYVCNWVQHHGGWVLVFRESISSCLMGLAFASVTVACCCYIRNNW